MKKKKFYAVRKGRIPGIYLSWGECEKQIKGYSGAEYKSFLTEKEAKMFIENKKTIRNLNVLPDEVIQAYVDGSFNSTKKIYGSGVVILKGEEKIVFSQKGEDKDLISMRNVAGEIKGAEIAMQYALDNSMKKVILYYDYEGIEKWCTGVWKANKKGTKAYQEFFNQASRNLDIEFVKVKAHSGDRYNEEADILAKKAVGI